mgnify:CR=1 FL=1
MKRIVICADGTWNRPEQLNKKQYPTNVLQFARAIAPKDQNNIKQVVFYDWGIGSYHDSLTGGGLGKGLEKNVMDGYRFLVHNYEPGDEIYLFGFSRGAYTVRSLCGLINNCSILKSQHGNLVEQAFDIYKTKSKKPKGEFSTNWRQEYAIAPQVKINFVGVWDTVGSMGLPFTIFGLIKDKHLFYDRKIGSNIIKARHALALDESRRDFEPTIWEHKPNVDMKQVWFAGNHSDIGGSYSPDKDGTTLADIPKQWLMSEAQKSGLEFEPYFTTVQINALATGHNEYKGKYKLLGKHIRSIPDPKENLTYIHHTVKERYSNSDYRNLSLDNYYKKHGNWPITER